MSDPEVTVAPDVVVVGVDGTGGGRDAVAAALTLTAEPAWLVLVHVRVGVPVALRGNGVASILDSRQQSLDLLDAERVRVAPAARTETVSASSVGDGLGMIAERRDARLIAVGGSRRAGLARMIHGDDALSTVRCAPCSVIVAPVGYADGRRPIERIGVAFDGSPESEAALADASRLADAHGAKIVVRDVSKVPAYGGHNWANTILDLDRDLHERVRGLVGHDVPVEASVAFGPAKLDLAAFSDGVDLLICGSRHLGFVRRLTGRSVSGYLARHCTCPVLIVSGTEALASVPAVDQPVSADL